MREFEIRPPVERVSVGPAEGKLLREAKDGSKEATEELVRRHWDRAHRIASAILGDPVVAEDVTQEAMISILSSLGRFDTRRPFVPWLHRVVTNRAIDWERARDRREQLTFAVSIFSPADPGPREALVAALGTLPLDQRTVVVLRHIAGYGTNEIARMLRLRRGTVGSRLRRGLDQLKRELENQDG
ncbi:MAG: RNA polymerase sigma factor [Actinobacteria bacterium]|nr:RNA polymerase sigma factor [Actinomycetota bacterium]